MLLSGNATDVLENATVFSSIEEAIKDSTYVYATSSRNRTIQWPTLNSETQPQLFVISPTREGRFNIIWKGG